MARYKLTYYNAKAIAEPIRFLFHYAGVEFEDNRLDAENGNWSSLKDSKWMSASDLVINPIQPSVWPGEFLRDI